MTYRRKTSSRYRRASTSRSYQTGRGVRSGTKTQKLLRIILTIVLVCLLFWLGSGVLNVLFGWRFEKWKPSVFPTKVDQPKSNEDLHINSEFNAIDKFSIAISPANITTPQELAIQLKRAPAESETALCRAAFVWIASHIRYDLSARTATSPTEVLGSKQAVCAGYSELFRAVCNELGIECESITGKANSGLGVQEVRHAWNAVKIDGSWKLLDVTWASGDGAEIRDGFFLVKPEEFIWTHFPSHSHWQLLSGSKIWNAAKFESVPPLFPEFFRLGLQLDSHEAKIIRSSSTLNMSFKLPKNESRVRLSAEIWLNDKKVENGGSTDILRENGRIPHSNKWEMQINVPNRIPKGSTLIIFATDEYLNQGNYTSVVSYELVRI